MAAKKTFTSAIAGCGGWGRQFDRWRFEFTMNGEGEPRTRASRILSSTRRDYRCTVCYYNGSC